MNATTTILLAPYPIHVPEDAARFNPVAVEVAIRTCLFPRPFGMRITGAGRSEWPGREGASAADWLAASQLCPAPDSSGHRGAVGIKECYRRSGSGVRGRDRHSRQGPGAPTLEATEFSEAV